MHLVSKEPVSSELLFLPQKKKKKDLGKCSAALFDACELFSPVLCVDAMYNLCTGRILECSFIFSLI